jgi:hypothetical protein
LTVPVIVGGVTPPLDDEEPPDDEPLEDELPPEEEPLLDVDPPPLEEEELLLEVEPPDEEELLLEDDPLLLEEDEPPDDEELPLGGGAPPPPPPPPQAAMVSVVTTVNDFSNVLIPYEDKFLTPVTRLRQAFMAADVTHDRKRFRLLISISAGAHSSKHFKLNGQRPGIRRSQNVHFLFALKFHTRTIAVATTWAAR